MRDPIRMLIVEQEPLLRRGLAGCLATDASLHLVGLVGSAAEAYAAADEHLPDVALVGTTLSDAPGLHGAAELRRRYPATAVIVVAERESDDEFFGALRSGAAAYCGQDVDETQLIDVIKRAATGEYVIYEQLLEKPHVAARLLDQFRNTSANGLASLSAFAPLTARELEILGKVSEGLTNAEIGFALGISSQTVKNHVTSILRKLAVNDRTQAVVTALKNGWLTLIDERDTPRPSA